MKLPQTEARRALLFARSPPSLRVFSYNAQYPFTGKHFCLLLSKWKPEGILRGEGEKCFTAGFRSPQAWRDLCLLHAGMSYPTCHRSWSLQHSPASAPNERRPHVCVRGTEKLKNPLGEKKKKRKRQRERCTTGATCEQGQSSHSSSFGKALLRR